MTLSGVRLRGDAEDQDVCGKDGRRWPMGPGHSAHMCVYSQNSLDFPVF